MSSEWRQTRGFAAWTRRVTAGEDGMRWNEIQNLKGHIQELSSYLIRVYLDARVTLR